MATTIPTLQAMAPAGVAPESAGGMPAQIMPPGMMPMPAGGMPGAVPFAMDTPTAQTNASIPVQLTLQVGSVSMALGQLLEVGVGTILRDEITSFFPKVKMLAGDRVIAEGDLVQVEGKVGLRISKLLG
jgi:flagellar motor switch/type III secretory pathway protein FliN